MLGIGGVTVVTVRDDWVEKVLDSSHFCLIADTNLEKGVGLLVTSDGTDSLDHWVTLVINTGLDAVSEFDAQRGRQVLVLIPEAGVLAKGLSEEGVVLKLF